MNGKTTNELIVEHIKKRLDVGQERYNGNVPLTGTKGRDNLYESLEEALDLAIYLAAEIVSIMYKRDKHDSH